MASIYRDWRIPASILVAACLIVSAYLLARGASKPPIAEASTETALLQAIATKDSTGDGLPDWEKSLYGIPLNATSTDYFGLGMTDGEAAAKGLIVPVANTPSTAPASPATSNTSPIPGAAEGTLTNAFAKNFFTLYVQAKEQANGAALTEAQISDISTRALAELSATIAPAPDFKTANNLTVRGSGTTALRAYAVAAEAVFAAHAANLPKSELDYLQASLNGDSSALDSLAKIAQSYRDTATGLAELPVPSELAATQLAMINDLARIAGAVTDFGRIKTDPAASMLALQIYPPALKDLVVQFGSVASIYSKAGVSFTAGTPGSYFVNLVQDLQSTQAATNKQP